MKLDKYCFGVDIGGTSVKLGLFSMTGELKEQWEIPTDRSERGKNVLGDIASSLLEKLSGRGIAREQVEGIGVGVPGPVLPDGTVMKCANLGWDIFNVNDALNGLTGIPVRASNDANVAALGEMWKGSGQGFKDMVFITLGTGVGGAIILNGKVHCGLHGGGGEIGHILVNPAEDDACGCGCRGHLEQYASATGIVRMARKLLDTTDCTTRLRDYEKINAKLIFDLAKEGDERCAELVDIMCAYLAQALSGVAASIDPEAYIIGGGVSKAGEIITSTIEKHFNANNLNVLRGREFRLALLGNDAGFYGAAALIATAGDDD